MKFPDNQWALILGGSSGFGLATAKKLGAQGLNVIVVHRDRRGAMSRIEPEFEAIRSYGAKLITFNADALNGERRTQIIATLADELGETGKIRLLLHSIALGNLKPLAPPIATNGNDRASRTENRDRLIERLATELGSDAAELGGTFDRLFEEGFDELHTLSAVADYGNNLVEDEDMSTTIYNMGTSLLAWVQNILERDMFTDDARVLGLTSEGNEVAWRGYAAVGAAKVAMESLARSMALELAPYGLRSNIIQAGITETRASALIPGIEKMKAQARLRNPFGRLTRPEDIANFIYLMCTDEAAWINGAIVRVDGGEHISGGTY
jgi:NAD(P)-dependent dehydrogenase (short-subunit alcohol dehydrogenase family)